MVPFKRLRKEPFAPAGGLFFPRRNAAAASGIWLFCLYGTVRFAFLLAPPGFSPPAGCFLPSAPQHRGIRRMAVFCPRSGSLPTAPGHSSRARAVLPLPRRDTAASGAWLCSIHGPVRYPPHRVTPRRAGHSSPSTPQHRGIRRGCVPPAVLSVLSPPHRERAVLSRIHAKGVPGQFSFPYNLGKMSPAYRAAGSIFSSVGDTIPY